jgi:hypothetical protein
MTVRSAIWTTVAVAALGLVACKTTQSPPPNSAGEVSAGAPTTTSGSGTTGGTTGSTSGTSDGTKIPTLVNVNLQNVLNDLSVSLKVNRNNIPVNAQVPINVAATVCGVSVNALAASAANGMASCTASTVTPQLTQAVQQQIASGGSVQGGPQTMGTPATTNNATENNMM